ncbi:MAG: tetratricopeptide repeat protein [Thermodesulfovibrionales bacterium]
MKSRNITYYLAASVSLATFGVYLAALRNDFVGWDDGTYVVDNPHIRTFDFAFLKWAFFDFYASNWHPLTWISHALDYAIWGLNPLGHHLTNNILHAVNTFLVVLLVVRLIEAYEKHPSPQPSPPRGEGRSSSPPLRGGDRGEGEKKEMPFTIHYSHSHFTLIAAATTGLLFGLHPIHVESVAWVAERKDLLCALFYLLSIMAYRKYAVTIIIYSPLAKGDKGGCEAGIAEKNKKQPPPPPLLRGNRSTTFRQVFDKHYLLSLLFFILALLSKPMAVSLPAVLLLLDWYPFERIRSLKTFLSSAIEKLPFIALSIGSSIITIMAQEKAMGLMDIVPLPARVLVAARALFSYLGKMIFPLGLSPFYPYSGNVFLLSPGYFLPLLLLVGLSASCIVIARKQKIWLSLWGYYAVTLVPVLGIVQVGSQSMADRYTYLPSLGPFLLAGLFAAWIYGKVYASGRVVKLVCISTVICLAMSLSYLTFKQIEIWNSPVGLWDYIIQKEPEKVPFAYYNRGIAFYRAGQMDRAIEDYSKAIALDPSYVRAYANRGFVFEKIGRLDNAIADYDKVIFLNPGESQSYNSRGVIFENMGLSDKAIADYDKAIDLNPSNADLYFNRGNAYDALGRTDKALADYDRAIGLNPRDAQAYNNRGLVFEKTGDLDKAIADYDKAITLDPSNAEAYNNRLAALEKKSGNPPK